MHCKESSSGGLFLFAGLGFKKVIDIWYKVVAGIMVSEMNAIIIKHKAI